MTEKFKHMTSCKRIQQFLAGAKWKYFSEGKFHCMTSKHADSDSISVVYLIRVIIFYYYIVMIDNCPPSRNQIILFHISLSLYRFCQSCLKQAILARPQCPYCRTPITNRATLAFRVRPDKIRYGYKYDIDLFFCLMVY